MSDFKIIITVFNLTFTNFPWQCNFHLGYKNIWIIPRKIVTGIRRHHATVRKLHQEWGNKSRVRDPDDREDDNTLVNDQLTYKRVQTLNDTLGFYGMVNPTCK